ncbi:LysR family transcriptional regulator [Microlunatus flavus]|uniref:DNA-binding transcriptional regulator, LysR family n=1 Tax=Microlunatus flavus TaxID=1036181 RepID=A0A1H9I118_9ACTN|nr:LysR family transcriptional regulator [Microlunatus flavus]SEQ68301.1 DNA-binding transcriptional regulator, LysR family [Microlunatus flavus]
MSVELRQLRALVAVVDEGSFTDAAIALGTTQASVSRAVAALEANLGARVLRRTTRSVAPNAVGARVLDHARQALAAVQALEQVAAHADADVRLGYAWSALGRHTVPVQRRWGEQHPGRPLTFVFVATPTAGLAEGLSDVAVLRRPVDDPRLAVEQVGLEARYAVLPTGDPLAGGRSVRLAGFAGRTVALDRRTGTTDEQLWAGSPAGSSPGAYREVHNVEDFLTMVAAGQVVGITSEATTRQHRRPGVVFRRVHDAPPVPVLLAWWREDPPAGVADVLALVREAYAAGAPAARA